MKAKRKPKIKGDIVFLPLTKGRESVIDLSDLQLVEGFLWLSLGPYAARRTWEGGKRKTVLLHRVINDTPDGMEADHINGDQLDNRGSNLRAVTRSQNGQNRKPGKNGTSRFKGVYWSTLREAWVARIYPKGRAIDLGEFNEEVDAAKAYDKEARKIYGPFSRINFP